MEEQHYGIKLISCLPPFSIFAGFVTTDVNNPYKLNIYFELVSYWPMSAEALIYLRYRREKSTIRKTLQLVNLFGLTWVQYIQN